MNDKDRKHWQAVFASNDAQAVSWYRAHLDVSLEMLKNVGLDTHSRVVDIGGGASMLVDDLLDRGIRGSESKSSHRARRRFPEISFVPIANFQPRFIATFVLTLSLLSACVTYSTPRGADALSGSVEATEIPAASDERYNEGSGVTFALPLPASENPMPAYPPSLLAAKLPPRTFAARLIFNEQGEVVEVRSLRDDTSEESAAFLASVREACRQWYYTALIERRHVTTHGPDGPEQSIIESPKPFHLDFQFTFSQTGGRGVVEGRADDHNSLQLH